MDLAYPSQIYPQFGYWGMGFNLIYFKLVGAWLALPSQIFALFGFMSIDYY